MTQKRILKKRVRIIVSLCMMIFMLLNMQSFLYAEEALPESSTNLEEILPESSINLEEVLPESSADLEEVLPESSADLEEVLPESSADLEEAMTEAAADFEEAMTEAAAENEEPQTKSSNLLSTFSLDMFEQLSNISAGIPLIPADSTNRSDVLALQMLGLSCGYSAESFANLFASSGFRVLYQDNFDKNIEDASHSSGYTIGKGYSLMGLVPKETLLVSIQGTSKGEWYSNFDVCPSHSEDALFAENFLLAAEEIFLTLKPYIDVEDDPIILICGHSRGAACANLLGMLVNEYADPDNVYVYTFATPATIRSNAEIPEYYNIFNYLDPCDIVPMLPFEKWQFCRAGQDIMLSVKDPDLQETIQRYIDTMTQIAPTLTAYYNDRLSLTSAGTDENGITAFEAMLLVSEQIISMTESLLNEDPEAILQPEETDTGFSDMVSEDSAFRPLADIYSEISANDYELGIQILLEHLPTTYYELINQYRLEN